MFGFNYRSRRYYGEETEVRPRVTFSEANFNFVKLIVKSIFNQDNWKHIYETGETILLLFMHP